MSGKKEKAVQFILPLAGGAVNQCYYVDEDELEEKLPADNTAALLEKAVSGRLSARSLTRHRDALLREAIGTDRAEALPALSQGGAAALGGSTTALGVRVKTAPCHIAALPLAINMGCSAMRRGTYEL